MTLTESEARKALHAMHYGLRRRKASGWYRIVDLLPVTSRVDRVDWRGSSFTLVGVTRVVARQTERRVFQ